MEESSSSLQDLPRHLLHNILTKGSLSAADLARFEASCYTFRAAHGLPPLRFKSVVEIAALDLCRGHPLYSSMPPQYRTQLLHRCCGNWKLLLRFLESAEQAYGSVTTPKGKIQVATGKYHTLLVHGVEGVFACGSGLPSTTSDQGSDMICNLFIPVALPRGVSVTHVASSYQHAAFITSRGELYTYGGNATGCCGLGEANRTIAKPTLVETFKGIPCKQVATGLNFTMVLTREGHVYTCGTNTHGQLGHGDALERNVATKVERLSSFGPVVQICAGATHALAVTQDGALYSWGYGANLCLGHGELANEGQPRLIQKFQEENLFVLRVAAGDEHSVAMDSNGQVYTWGKGYCGSLGQGDENDKPTPERVALADGIRSVQVCAKKRKTFVLGDNGMLFAFGWMAFGSLGLTDRGNSEKVLSPSVVDSLKRHHISQVSAGLYHTLVVTNKGTVLGFGDNERGQLGLGYLHSCPEPMEIALKFDNTDGSPIAAAS